MLLYASHLLNPRRSPVAEAVLWIQGDRIRYAGPRAELPIEAKQERQSLDLGEAVLAPGLVNAHAHLELTALKGLKYSGDFVDWIRAVLQAKQALEPQRQDHEMHEGVLRLLRGGATCVGDHLSVASNPESLLRSPLRGKAFV
ncbi:amidohydrolase family protein, partial [bacterium]